MTQAQQQPSASFQFISPDMARAMLAKNTSNRNLRPNHVADLVRDMRSGNFQLNGDAIRFDINGVLLDGQHRLTAIERSGIPQQMLVIENLPPEVMLTIDSGVKRTNGDRLSIHGVKNGNGVASALGILHMFAKNNFAVRLTPTEVFDIFSKHTALEDSCRASNGTGYSLNSIMGAFHYMGHYTGYGELADEFLETFKSGFATVQGDPAHTARERIIRIKAGQEKVHRDYILAVVATAWEAKRRGKLLQTIRQSSQIEFPRVHGWSEEDLMNPQGRL